MHHLYSWVLVNGSVLHTGTQECSCNKETSHWATEPDN